MSRNCEPQPGRPNCEQSFTNFFARKPEGFVHPFICGDAALLRLRHPALGGCRSHAEVSPEIVFGNSADAFPLSPASRIQNRSHHPAGPPRYGVRQILSLGKLTGGDFRYTRQSHGAAQRNAAIHGNWHLRRQQQPEFIFLRYVDVFLDQRGQHQ